MGIWEVPVRREIPQTREIPEFQESPGNYRIGNSREGKVQNYVSRREWEFLIEHSCIGATSTASLEKCCPHGRPPATRPSYDNKFCRDFIRSLENEAGGNHFLYGSVNSLAKS